MEEELYQWEDKYKKCQSVDNLKKRLNTLMGEYTWCVAIDCEKTIENLEKEKKTLMKSKEKHEQKLNEHKEKQTELTDKDKQIQIDYNKVKNEINSKKKEREVVG